MSPLTIPMETSDIGVFGRVDGTGELHPEGSYISIWTATKSGEKRNHRISIGLAENLIAELLAAIGQSASFAAAPELYVALRDLLQYIDDHDWGTIPEGATADRARAALTKVVAKP